MRCPIFSAFRAAQLVPPSPYLVVVGGRRVGGATEVPTPSSTARLGALVKIKLFHGVHHRANSLWGGKSPASVQSAVQRCAKLNSPLFVVILHSTCRGTGGHDAAMRKQTMEGGRETKRVKLMHTAAINTSSAPVQRRLRKMSEEFQPSTFSFLVEARLLCVGLAAVYRVSLSLTITSTCISTTSDGGHTRQSSWVIAMSQTKFRGFYAQVATILNHPTVAQHLNIQQQPDEDQELVVEWKPFEVFLRILKEVFHRYEHLQYAAFSIHADAATMNIGKVELEGFLSECWRALEIIVPVLVVEPYLPAPLGREVLCIYLLMRDFLSLPDSVLDANCTYANAILSLEDVEDLLPTHSEQSCSICLELLVSSEMKRLGLAESDQGNINSGHSSDNNANVSCISDDTAVPDASSGNFSVKLPCAHVYHENCIMSWLRHNPSCPECRAPVGTGI
ncbi:unnamed protein product [Phytophthora fragariaefolia]|uniref:Unnamed protein product n=1 Tax=Phytophthora fragariaefolia TaxID=1490495 RepID=A0A9W6U839_9STRA|nr:unnamed protein product [Phytophthora fragariaefolia]